MFSHCYTASASTSSTTSSPSQTASNGTASRPADSTSASNSSNNAYMEDLINTYFDPNTRNLSSAGLNELMEAIGVRGMPYLLIYAQNWNFKSNSNVARVHHSDHQF